MAESAVSLLCRHGPFPAHWWIGLPAVQSVPIIDIGTDWRVGAHAVQSMPSIDIWADWRVGARSSISA